MGTTRTSYIGRVTIESWAVVVWDKVEMELILGVKAENWKHEAENFLWDVLGVGCPFR